jgi:ABC-2 type transport system permease protein
MNEVMLRRSLKDLRWLTVWFTVGAALYLLAILAFYPSIRGNAAEMEELLDVYPEALKEAFGIEDFTTLPGFIGSEVLNVIWPIIAAAFMIVAGSATVAGEIERGTIDLWLSAPVARWRLLASKVGAIFTGGLGMVLATVAALGLGALAIDESIGLRELAALALTLLALVWVMLGYSVLLSALLSSRGQAAGIASAVTLLSYLAWVIGGISARFDWLRDISIFSAYQAQPAVSRAEVHWFGLGILIALGALCIGGALLVFQRRDAIGG